MKRLCHFARYYSTLRLLDENRFNQLATSSLSPYLTNFRYASGQPNKESGGGFFQKLVDSINQEAEKNRQLQENLKKLKEETKKMEDSDALKKARQKFDIVQQETLNSTEVLKKKFNDLNESLKNAIEEAKKTPQGQKIAEMGEEVLKQTKNAADAIGKSHEAISSTQAYQAVSSNVMAVANEFDQITIANANLYRTPESLKMRSSHVHTSATVDPNSEATGVTLHKDSQWYQSWKNWKDNSPYLNKFLEWKMYYDESEHPAARMGRFVTGKMASVFYSKSELSTVLTEVCRVDPDFSLEKFQNYVEREMVPNILEALARQDFDVLKDWCHERAYSQLSHPVIEGSKLGYIYVSKIIDIGRCEVVMAKMTEQGPVLIVNFTVQSVEAMQTSDGKVVEGDLDAPVRAVHTWVVCRDMEQINPLAAWKLLEYMRQNPQKMFF